jgi:membrane protease YdiL (CAAX protease family)
MLALSTLGADHQSHLTPAAVIQVAFTIPMGIIFGRLRQEPGSLWPGLALHVVTNLPGALESRLVFRHVRAG